MPTDCHQRGATDEKSLLFGNKRSLVFQNDTDSIPLVIIHIFSHINTAIDTFIFCHIAVSGNCADLFGPTGFRYGCHGSQAIDLTDCCKLCPVCCFFITIVCKPTASEGATLQSSGRGQTYRSKTIYNNRIFNKIGKTRRWTSSRNSNLTCCVLHRNQYRTFGIREFCATAISGYVLVIRTSCHTR